MADKSLIEWTDTTWQIVTGCSVVSPGCTNCYAMRLAGGRMQHHPSRAGLTVETKAGPVWNGQVRFNENWLTQPLHWKTPRKIFVAAHGDLFHEGVEMHQLDRIFAIMALCPQHTFQILTKRSDWMREYVSGFGDNEHGLAWRTRARIQKQVRLLDADYSIPVWPLPNVWLGVSVEDQTRANERIPALLATPAAVRWISAEPLLGPIDLMNMPFPKECDCLDDGPTFNAFSATVYCPGCCEGPEPMSGGTLDWVVAGGESGKGARPTHPDWARQLRDQCEAAEVPFLFKQWGAWREFGHVEDGPDVTEVEVGTDLADAFVAEVPVDQRGWINADGRGFYGHPDNLPEGVWRFVEKIGKGRAGRTLDGQIHDGYPA